MSVEIRYPNKHYYLKNMSVEIRYPNKHYYLKNMSVEIRYPNKHYYLKNMSVEIRYPNKHYYLKNMSVEIRYPNKHYYPKLTNNLVYNNKIDLEPAKCVTKRVRGSCHPALRLCSPSAPPLTVAAGDSLWTAAHQTPRQSYVLGPSGKAWIWALSLPKSRWQQG